MMFDGGREESWAVYMSDSDDEEDAFVLNARMMFDGGREESWAVYMSDSDDEEDAFVLNARASSSSANHSIRKKPRSTGASRGGSSTTMPFPDIAGKACLLTCSNCSQGLEGKSLLQCVGRVVLLFIGVSGWNKMHP